MEIIRETVNAPSRKLSATWQLDECIFVTIKCTPDKEWSRPEYPPMEECPYKEEKC